MILTADELRIVEKQCQYCEYWDYRCQFVDENVEDWVDGTPFEDCGKFRAKSKESVK